MQRFSIHALLAESDCRCKRYRHHQAVFYPRSPCGERPFAEADCSNRSYVFYPRSPCGERRKAKLNGCEIMPFSIHALLAESDRVVIQVTFWTTFSIHALLAESDNTLVLQCTCNQIFYPRSPCGERPPPGWQTMHPAFFLSTLSLRRATQSARRGLAPDGFLSTLSLRRATAVPTLQPWHAAIFYPRSPCGERRAVPTLQPWHAAFSIHALLAESDINACAQCVADFAVFYPRSPCGERLVHVAQDPSPCRVFYPRSPCGERPA